MSSHSQCSSRRVIPREDEPFEAERTMTLPHRDQLIARLQTHIDSLGLPHERICPYSFRKAFFCRGFAQWLWDVRERRRNGGGTMLPLSAAELRGLLDSWSHLRLSGLAGNHCRGVLVDEYRLPCDGWDEWTDDDLLQMCRDFCLAVESGAAAGS